MNQTGPMGQGPLTGRGMGNCAGGQGMSRCGRPCFGRRAILTKEERLQALEGEEALTLRSLEEIKKEKKLLSEEK